MMRSKLLMVILLVISLFSVVSSASAQTGWLQNLYRSAPVQRKVPNNFIRGMSFVGGGGGGPGTFLQAECPYQEDTVAFWASYEGYQSGDTIVLQGLGGDGYGNYPAICGHLTVNSAFAIAPDGSTLDALIVYPFEQTHVLLPLEAFSLPGLWHLVIPDQFDLYIDVPSPPEPFLIADISTGHERLLLGGFTPGEQIRGIVLDINWGDEVYVGEIETQIDERGYALLETDLPADESTFDQLLHAFFGSSGSKVVYYPPLAGLMPVMPNSGLFPTISLGELGNICEYRRREFEQILSNMFWNPSAPSVLAQGYANTLALNFRGGPGPEYPLVGRINGWPELSSSIDELDIFNSSLTFAGRNTDGTWLRLNTPDPRWVNARYINVLCGNTAELMDLSFDVTNTAPNLNISYGETVSGVIYGNGEQSQTWIFQGTTGSTIALDLTMDLGSFELYGPDGFELSNLEGNPYSHPSTYSLPDDGEYTVIISGPSYDVESAYYADPSYIFTLGLIQGGSESETSAPAFVGDLHEASPMLYGDDVLMVGSARSHGKACFNRDKTALI